MSIIFSIKYIISITLSQTQPTRRYNMDSSNRRPLLQQSSEDEASDLDFVVKSQTQEPSISTSSSSRSVSNASTVTARKLSKDDSIREINEADEDNDDEDDAGTTRRIDVNAAKELLRSENAPKDRFGFNYIVFYLLGMTTLLPWNFFITAEDVSFNVVNLKT